MFPKRVCHPLKRAVFGTAGTRTYYRPMSIYTAFLCVHSLLYRSSQCILYFYPHPVNPYLSSALVKKILSWGFLAFREHTGSNSGYMKTLLVARIQATCFGKQGNLQAIRKKCIINETPEQKRASQKLLNAFWHLERADPK